MKNCNKVLAILGISILLIAALIFHFALLYCFDASYCHYPVSSYPQQQIAFKIKKMLSPSPHAFRVLLQTANYWLVAEAILLMYVVLNFIRNHLGYITAIVTLSVVIVYGIFSYEQYTKEYG
mgnify:CR=1 FL=1